MVLSVCRLGTIECFLALHVCCLADMLLPWSPHFVYQCAACCAPSISHGFALSAVPQDLLLPWIFCLPRRGGVIERFMVLHVCGPADMLLLWSFTLCLSICRLLRILNEPWHCTFCCPAGLAVVMDFCLRCRVGMIDASRGWR